MSEAFDPADASEPLHPAESSAPSRRRLPRFDAWLFWPPGPVLFMINRLIGQEPWAIALLQPFAGKQVRISLKPFSMTLSVNEESRLVRAQQDAVADLLIEVPPSELAGLALAPDRAQSLIRIEGDTEFAQALNQLAKHLRPDLEEQLSRVVGDVLAVRIVAGLNAFSAGLRNAQRRLAENVAEYLLEERPQLVRPRDIDAFTADVRTLRDDFARLEKRVERLTSSS